MKYILEFEKWIGAIREGINIKVNDDSETKDDIIIDDIIYSIDSDNNVTQNNNQEIDSKALKDDIKDASHAINILKKTERDVELRRITGGDKRIIDKINEFIKKGIVQNNILFDPDVFEETYFYKNIEYGNINNEVKRKIVDLYNTTNRGIGKGEYFLPIIYHDVYKKKPYIEIGDNFIKNNETEINLELKGSNIGLKFDKTSKNNLNNKDNKHIYNDILKNEIVTSFLNYAMKESSKRENLYMCIFVVDNIDNAINNAIKQPKGMVFINLTKEREILHDILMKKIITISDEKFFDSDKYDFKYNAKYDENKDEIKIECILNQKYHQQYIKSKKRGHK